MAVEPTTEGEQTPARPARRPVGATFLIFGAYMGAWAVAVLDIQRSFGLSDTELGLILAIGILLAAGLNAVGGALTDRWGAGVALATVSACAGVGVAGTGRASSGTNGLRGATSVVSLHSPPSSGTASVSR